MAATKTSDAATRQLPRLKERYRSEIAAAMLIFLDSEQGCSRRHGS